MLADFQDDYCFVVEAVVGALKCANVGEDGVGDLLGGLGANGTEERGETLVAVHVVLVVFSVENAVGQEDDNVAGLGGDGELLIGDVGKEAEGKAFSLDDNGLAGTAKERLDGTGVGDLEGLVFIVPESEKKRDVLRIELALLEPVVEQGHHVGRLGELGGGGAHDAAY